MFQVLVIIFGLTICLKICFTCFFVHFDEGDRYAITNQYINFADYIKKKQTS
jgi:hypothetical protein